MEKGQFTPPSVIELEGILVKATHVASHNIVELLVREVGTNQLRTLIAGVKALGLSTLTKGCNVLAVCENRVAGVTQYINDLKTVTTHERTGLSLSRIINLDADDNEIDFSALSTPSQEPA
jgi:hypothetical protein